MSQRVNLSIDEMAVRYESGDTTLALGHAYGVSRQTIARHLRAAGVSVRKRGGGAPPGNRYGLGNRSRQGTHKRGGPLSDMHGYLRSADRDGNQCLVHRVRYEAYHGPIPPKMDIHHSDNNRRNNTIDNLVCLSRADHARLHGEVGRCQGSPRN